VLPRRAEVTLDIYNAAGQKIRTLATGSMEAGEHNVRWNGLLDSGVSAASGVYFARLKAGNVFTTSRMMLER
jgi:flagellar hook assembly protein FlgD